jgi:predicted O-methyltransferase YrrM
MRVLAAHPLRPPAAMPFRSDAAFSDAMASVYAHSRDSARAKLAPTDNPYALRPDTLAFLFDLLENLEPSGIVEFGCGESTRVFASWAAGRKASFVSLENDPAWIARLEQTIEKGARDSVSFVHAPLRMRRFGTRTFFTYDGLEELTTTISQATFFFLDGPHSSGREPVLYSVLNHCKVGSTILLDDFNLYHVRDMLAAIPRQLAVTFAGAAIESNSHGLYALRRLEQSVTCGLPPISVGDTIRSYWRAFSDYRKFGSAR